MLFLKMQLKKSMNLLEKAIEERAQLDEKKFNFLYSDDNNCHFMDPENYDQKIKIAIRVSKIKNGDYRVNLNNGKPVYKNLVFEKSFNKRFFNLGQIYHPNEIFANFVAD